MVVSAMLLAPLAMFGQENSKKVTSYVNPFIGTGAVESSLSGNNYPGATTPFGMIQLSPDTSEAPDWGDASGYDYNKNKIYGFSHTRLSGTGAADLFDVMLMPTTNNEMSELHYHAPVMKSAYSSTFSHDQESAKPGYYQVKLQDLNINAELTATTRAGFHRYSFPEGAKEQLIFDIVHSRDKGGWGTKIINSQLRVVDEYTVQGYRVITGWAKLRKVYFYAKFSKPIQANVMTDGYTFYHNNEVVNGSHVRAVLDFNTKEKNPLLVKIGLSPVSIENAKENLEKEIKGWDFDATVAAAEQQWEKELGKIQIEGNDLQKEIFYTALYHTFIQPNTLSDVNGEFMAADYSTYRLEKGVHYTTFSLWDTYRGAHPLYTILQPERTTDFVNSMISQYETYGYLPIWQLWGQDNYCMIGNHSIPVIVDAIFKGIPGIDVKKAYEAVYKSSTINHPTSPFNTWEKYKYMPENLQTQSVSITLEMAYDDWCVAQLAKKLGKNEDYKRFSDRAQFYRNLYNPKSTFFQGKDDKGNWMEPFDPFKYGANGGYPFTEGNAWQYFWYVPQDVNDLVHLTGGKDTFVKRLDDFFTLDHRGELNHNASGFIGQYAHGNEPSHHVTYLYNYVGEPWKTQFYVSKILNELYNNTSSGYAGNDDCGEMSAWYVFSAMGFYPVNPANGVYAIGSPLLESATIKLPAGKTFTVRAKKSSPEDIYIQSAKLNGKQYDRTYITHDDLMKGGSIEFEMGSKPSQWGTKEEDKPIDWGF